MKSSYLFFIFELATAAATTVASVNEAIASNLKSNLVLAGGSVSGAIGLLALNISLFDRWMTSGKLTVFLVQSSCAINSFTDRPSASNSWSRRRVSLGSMFLETSSSTSGRRYLIKAFRLSIYFLTRRILFIKKWQRTFRRHHTDINALHVTKASTFIPHTTATRSAMMRLQNNAHSVPRHSTLICY